MEHLEGRDLLAGDLRITEVNYHPHPSLLQFGERDVDADDYEFVEVANLGDAPMDIGGYALTNGVNFLFASQTVQPGERLVVVQDPRDFAIRYGNNVKLALGDGGNGQDPGEFAGSLNNTGEQIQLDDPSGSKVQEFNYYDSGEWPFRADGGGSSLEVIDPFGDLDDPKNWRASAEFGGSPGWAGTGNLGDVVINELLTHTDEPQVDTIELYNTTDAAIDMTGWYISDSLANLFRFRIPAAQGMIGSDQYAIFNELELGYGFRGQESDNAFLVEPDAAGKPIRFVDGVSYGATQNGVTLGRWPNATGDLFPMDGLTFDDFNSGPLVGDVVISEVHYHPADDPEGILGEDDMEFVELFNRSGAPLNVGEWQLDESVRYTIPAGTTMAPRESIIIVGFAPALEPVKEARFRQMYGVADDIPLFGPFQDDYDPNADRLDNSGESLILQRPEDILQLGLGYVLVDRVRYSDDAPWPEAADGDGLSLTRTDIEGYGNFPETWAASIPSPGRSGTPGDINRDGSVNVDDVDELCVAVRLGGANPNYDLDANGTIDRQDVLYLVRNILHTNLGDSNGDGIFNSGDLVQVFTAGQYEDAVAGNSTWSTGDWNCDGEFATSDLVFAFQEGTYSATAVPVSSTGSSWSAGILLDSSDRVAGKTDETSFSGDKKVTPHPSVLMADSIVYLESKVVDSFFAESELQGTPKKGDRLVPLAWKFSAVL
ncbi:MAG: lamin tail domain-containing protein [Planctomycetales bacterium]|nr:lamin tail domain-containing protein [Planctomycetales bacterium]